MLQKNRFVMFLLRAGVDLMLIDYFREISEQKGRFFYRKKETISDAKRKTLQNAMRL